MNWSLATNFAIALLAIANPLGKVPLWVEASQYDVRGVRWRLAVLLTLTGTAILLLFLLFGQAILSFFGIDVASFRIGGGIVLLLIGISMLNGEAVVVEPDEDEDEDLELYTRVKQRFSQFVVPLCVPMIAGPGSITTVLIYGSRADGWMEYALMTGVLLAIMAIVLGTLLSGHKLRATIGTMALKVQTRLFGLILIAIAVQFMVEGLGEVFPAWLEGATSPLEQESSTGGSTQG